VYQGEKGYGSGLLLYGILVSDDQNQATSGNPAVGWVSITTPEDGAALILAILTSDYCYYRDGKLLNTDITS
jgi:hypothetical protein